MRSKFVSRGMYGRFKVEGDIQGGFVEFNTNRKNAFMSILSALNEKVIALNHLLQPAVKEALGTPEFFKYLKKKILTREATHAAILNSINTYASHPGTLIAFVKYNIKVCKNEKSWAHPGVLRAFALVEGWTLYIWTLDPGGNLIPLREKGGQDYFECRGSDPNKRKDLLHLRRDLFDKLDLYSLKDEVNEMQEVNSFEGAINIPDVPSNFPANSNTNMSVEGNNNNNNNNDNNIRPNIPIEMSKVAADIRKNKNIERNNNNDNNNVDKKTLIVKPNPPKADTRIDMRDFNQGDGHHAKELYEALAESPDDHRIGKWAMGIPYLRPFLPVATRSFVQLVDWAAEKVDHRLVGLGLSAGLFFSDRLMEMAADWGSSEAAIWSIAVVMGIGFYHLGGYSYISASQIYLYFRGDRSAEFPMDYLEKLDEFMNNPHAPHLDSTLRHPKNLTECKEFFKFHSNLLLILFHAHDFEGIARALSSLRKRFPYVPVHQETHEAVEFFRDDVEEKRKADEASNRDPDVELVEQQAPMSDEVYNRVQRVKNLQAAHKHSAYADQEKKNDYIPSANQHMFTVHLAPSSRPAREVIKMYPASKNDGEPEEIQRSQRKSASEEARDIFSCDLIEGGVHKFIHMPNSPPINLPPARENGPVKIDAEVTTPDVDINNMAIYLAEFVGRLIQQAPLRSRENYSQTGLNKFCCAGACCCAGDTENLRRDLHVKLLEAVLKENPAHQQGGVVPFPHFNFVEEEREEYILIEDNHASVNADLPKPKKSDEYTPLLDDAKPVVILVESQEAPKKPYRLEKKHYRYPGVESDLHRRSLELLCLNDRPTGTKTVKWHDANYFRRCKETQFYIFMKLSVKSRVRFIFILLSGYEGGQLRALSFLKNEYLGKTSWNPVTWISEEGILQKSYDGKKYSKFMKNYVAYCKQETIDPLRVAQHIYVLTSLPDKRSEKHLRALFENEADLASEIILALMNPNAFQDFYLIHAMRLISENRVNAAAEVAIYKKLLERNELDCILKLQLASANRINSVANSRFTNDLRVSSFLINQENEALREATFQNLSVLLEGSRGNQHAAAFASNFIGIGEFHRFYKKGDLALLRKAFEENLNIEPEKLSRAISRLAFALMKSEVGRKEGRHFAREMQKKSLIVEIITDTLFNMPKNEKDNKDYISPFFEIGTQLIADGLWDDDHKDVFKRIFSCCIYPGSNFKNPNLRAPNLLDGLIHQFTFYDEIKKKCDNEIKLGNSENAQVLKDALKQHQWILYSLLQGLVETSLQTTGLDSLALMTALANKPFPRGFYFGLFRAIARLDINNEQKYRFLYQLMCAYNSDIDFSEEALWEGMNFSKALLSSKDGILFGEMWLFLACFRIDLVETSTRTFSIVNKMLRDHLAEMPINAPLYLMEIFCKMPKGYCDEHLRPIFFKQLFSRCEGFNYKAHSTGFLRAITIDGDPYKFSGFILKHILLPGEPIEVETKATAFRYAAMTIFTIYEELYTDCRDSNTRKNLRLYLLEKSRSKMDESQRIKIEISLDRMIGVLSQLHEALGEFEDVNEFIKRCARPKNLFRTLFCQMGFSEKIIAHVFLLLSCRLENKFRLEPSSEEDDAVSRLLGDFRNDEANDGENTFMGLRSPGLFQRAPSIESVSLESSDDDVKLGVVADPEDSAEYVIWEGENEDRQVLWGKK